MRMSKKRSLIGYHPPSLKQLVESLQSAFVAEKTRLETELITLTHENSELSDRVGVVTKQVSGHLAFEREISEKLFQSHLEYTKKWLSAAPTEAKTPSDSMDPPTRTELGQEQKKAY